MNQICLGAAGQMMFQITWIEVVWGAAGPLMFQK
jgi:hypothetical protein